MSTPPARGTTRRVRLGELLVEAGELSREELDTALAEQKKRRLKLGRTIVELGYIDEERLLAFLARQLRVPLVDLATQPLDPELIRLLPETHARRLRAIVLEDRGASLRVGMSDPTDIFAADEIGRIVERPIERAVVRESDLLRILDLAYRRTDEITNFAEQLREELAESDFAAAPVLGDDESSSAPVAKLLTSIFEDAVQVRASDVHIEPDESVLRIRLRVDGLLQEQVMKEKRIAPALVQRLKLMAGLDISEKRLPQDGRFHTRVRGRDIDVRLATMPVAHGESVVMRLLDQSAGILDLDQLGMPAPVLERVRVLLRQPHGLILVTGPTGSGKTTTLYAALSILNEAERKIITVEDPVEYRIPRISQVQVNHRIDLDFARVLRSALRQDPDVVMVGEMRDHETALIGLRAAMTGHLVLSTLHTNDSITSAARLVDMGAPGYLVASSLRAVLAQRLVRRVCDRCAEPHEPDDSQRRSLLALLGPGHRPPRTRLGRGCAQCHGTGHRGRLGVYELLEIDAELADALRRGDDAAFARAAPGRPGFRSLAGAAFDRAIEGTTTLAEALRLAGDLDPAAAAALRAAQG